MPAADLAAQARAFAASITSLLNHTVTTGIRISAVIRPTEGLALLARGITKQNVTPASIPLTLGDKAPVAYLWLAYTLKLDPEGLYLTVLKSGYALWRDQVGDHMLLHYDYEREPAHEYPAAHLQVNGYAAELCELSVGVPGGQKELKDFHFPVGGRRYRPTLEDLIEFLVTEGLVDAHRGWDDVLAYHRAAWEERQLRAAVRRHPEVAMDQLRESGHTA